MAHRCVLYYITDRSQFPGDESARRRALLEKIAEAASAAVDYIQLREKDLQARKLENLAREAARLIEERRPTNNEHSGTTSLLINSRTDVALAVHAQGVHLPANDISPSEVRQIVNRSGQQPHKFVIGVSCHATSDVTQAESGGADFAVFGPVFEKSHAPEIQPKTWAELREACTARIPVLALGGITLSNAVPCLAAGAAGIAAIRLFQENKIEEVVRALRRL